jgi:hypothetical protein
MGGGGGFRTKKGLAEENERIRLAGKATDASISERRKQIEEDKTISDVTRTELLTSLKSGITVGELNKAGERFQEAQTGESSEFKARQQRQAAIDIAREQPGRRQTVLGKRSLI